MAANPPRPGTTKSGHDGPPDRGTAFLRVGRRTGVVKAAGAFSHELIEIGLILGAAQTLQEGRELLLLLFKPVQRFGAVFIEGAIAARCGIAPPAPFMPPTMAAVMPVAPTEVRAQAHFSAP